MGRPGKVIYSVSINQKYNISSIDRDVKERKLGLG